MLSFVLAGCGVIVAPEDDPVLCEISPDGTDPCPAPARCMGGRCVGPMRVGPDATIDASGDIIVFPPPDVGFDRNAPDAIPDAMPDATPRCPPPTPCEANQRCDELTGECVTLVPEPMANGATCTAHDQCASQLCAPRAAAGLTGGGQVCASTCCTDDDCAGNEICWYYGAGAKLCLPATLLGRTRGPGGLDASCTANADCRSGLCEMSSDGLKCVTNCAYDGDCGGYICGNITFMRDAIRVTQSACVTAGTGSATMCGSGGDNDCPSLVCVANADGSPCSKNCRTSADCAERGANETCGFDATRSADLPGTTTPMVTHACVAYDGPPRIAANNACTTDEMCHDGACVGGFCRSTCCTGCPGGDVCRLVERAPYWLMRCLPASMP